MATLPVKKAVAKKAPARPAAKKAASPAAKKAPAKKAPAKKAPAKKAPALGPEQYGYVKQFLSAHPDVSALVAKAVKERWTPELLQQRVKTTKWWRDRSEAERQYDVLSAENPAELAKKVSDKQQEITLAATRMGVTIPAADVQKMATDAFRSAWSDSEIAAKLAKRFALPAGQAGEGPKPVIGSAGQALDELRKVSGDYGVTLTHDAAQTYTQQILAGTQTVDGLRDVFREQAKVLYSPISDYLDKNPGASVRDYMSPYLSIASQELGIPADQMDITNPMWSAVIHGEGGQPMNSEQWTKRIRTDTQYGWDYTPNARAQAAQIAASLQRTFGATG